MSKSKKPDNFIRQLQQCVADDALLTDQADCLTYGYDNSRLTGEALAVVFPADHDQVKSIVALCYKNNIPVIARGRGTGTTGAVVPTEPCVVLSTERMNHIIEVNARDRYAVVEPGVINQDLQTAANEHDLFWPPDPTSAAFCTIGGNLAYNSAGPRAVKYGTPRDNTLGLKAVLGTGEEITTGVFTTKGVVGYDLTRLLIGSEGTLAIITQATLKLTRKADAISTIQVFYTSIEAATEAIVNLMSMTHLPAALEFIDSQCLELIRQAGKVEIPDKAHALLMIEVEGNDSELPQRIKDVKDATAHTERLTIITAKDEAHRKELWQSRKALSPALRTLAPKKINEDIVVPVSRIPEFVNSCQAISNKYQVLIVNFGHAGNGNLHVNLLIDPDDPAQAKVADQCLQEIFDLTLSLRGTISGEHGIGLVKKKYVSQEIANTELQLMNKIKQQFDPANILNPDKSFPSVT